MSADTSPPLSKYPRWERTYNIIPDTVSMLVQHMAVKSTALFLEDVKMFDNVVKSLMEKLPKAMELMLETEIGLVEFGQYSQLRKEYSDEDFTTFFTLYN